MLQLLSPRLTLLWIPSYGGCGQHGKAQGRGRHYGWFPALGNPDRTVFAISFSIGRQTVLSAQSSMVIAPTQPGGPSQELSLSAILVSVMSYALRWGCPGVLFCLSCLYRWLKTLCLYKLETIRLGQRRQPEAIS